MKKQILIFIILSLNVILYSQGYKIEVQITGLANERAILGHHFAGKMYPDDTISLNYSGYGIFTGENPLTQGMYVIYIESNKTYFDLLIGEDQFFRVDNNAEDLFRNARFTGSPENQQFYDYQYFLSKKKQESESLSTQSKNTTDEYEKKRISDQLKDFEVEVRSRVEQINYEYPNTFLSTFLTATSDIQVPDAPRDRFGNIIDSSFQYKYYKQHYFDNFDVSDYRLLRTPLYENKILQYLDKVVYQLPDSIIPEVDILILKSRKSPELFRYMLATLFNHYAKSETMGFDAITCYIAEKYYFSEASWAEPSFIEKLKDFVNKNKPLLIGKKAPDTQMVNVSDNHFMEASNNEVSKKDPYVGNYFNLLDNTSKYTILFFYEPDCKHCQKEAPLLHDFYLKNKNNGISVIAINMLTGAEGKEKWTNFINEHKLYDWVNAWNPYDFKVRELYDITSTPRTYILDKDKKIIGKKIGISQLQDFLSDYDAKSSQQKSSNISKIMLADVQPSDNNNKNNSPDNTQQVVQSKSQEKVFLKDDVDNVDIEQNVIIPFKFALVIGNERYSRFQPNAENGIDAEFAENDADAFAKYCSKVLGVADRNIFLLKNATLGQILYNVNKISNLVKFSNGKAEVVFYYAGHGLVDQVSKEPYLVPIDADPNNFESQIKLSQIYAKLGENPSRRVTAYVDASFNGGGRNQPLVKARGVKIKPKETGFLKNNMFVFYATSNEQTATIVKNKKHGVFTYSLLKAFKETKANIAYDQLFTMIKINMAQNIPNTQQLPSILLTESDKMKISNSYVYDGSGLRSAQEVEFNVDNDIPHTNLRNANLVALVIGNEDYSTFQTDLNSEINVDFAKNDASVFKQYLVNTLGADESNIVFCTNATLSQINTAVQNLQEKIKSLNGKAEVVFYYAGHGLPDETTKEPYIMPVDISGSNIKAAIKISTLYKKLTEYPSKKINVFLDACFSGGARNQGLLSLRGVKVKPKTEMLANNLVVIASSSGEESSSSYNAQKHGMFTYYLLRRINETKGNCTYDDLYKYLKEKVSYESVFINNKSQTPQLMYSPSLNYSLSSMNVFK
jgi:uncharacterized caspase-like protein/thiol-disulfide isomerase/thioredoxin